MSIMQEQERDLSGCPIIQRDPQKMSGAPTVAGQRITPDALVDNYNDGLSVDELQEQFPGVPEQNIRIVLNYAAQRGFLVAHSA